VHRAAARSIAVAFLARGAGEDWQASCARFIASYRRHRAGSPHSFNVIFKGFADTRSLAMAKRLFEPLEPREYDFDDESFDIGAYIEWANQISEESICVLNTASEILAEGWLAKLAVNLAQPNVGMVGATGSFESLNDWNEQFPVFPNVHLRSNAFMVDRALMCRLTSGLRIQEKIDAFNFESGADSLSKRIMALGKEILVVGRNGRGYAPKFWPSSSTFRLGFQDNLLVADNQTRNYIGLSWNEKREFVLRTWGHYIHDFELLT
jgi:hypothetical protein